ncbi:hypothetical protein GCK72_004251 [Caenorhabditis remanei]|uniref:Uncharacterized protein n=1 Tax=Caenorhabditis remanei TaxID=31234 RepID=A0A6A5HBX2_CAERE|nr:hypothetical protein GCK72_004251 [Caenorhabditis remanei]KAF1764304.1 hypothetical protein GCK72_004251 [Caenorhabditis remanei]
MQVLLSYICLRGEGGFCTMDVFKTPDDKEGCTYLRPWYSKDHQWQFYFEFNRRPRVFGRHYQQRVKNGTRKRHVAKTETSTKTIGTLTLYGMVDCDKVCKGEEFGPALGAYGDATFHKGRAHRLWY